MLRAAFACPIGRKRRSRHLEEHLYPAILNPRHSTSAEDSKTSQAQNRTSSPRPGTVKERGAEFACGCEFPGIVSSRNRRVHRLVLLGATISLQPDGGPPVPILPGAEQSRSLHHQCALGRSAATCLRSCRHRPPEPRTGCEYPACQRRE